VIYEVGCAYHRDSCVPVNLTFTAGVVARRFKKTSDFGGYLDIVVDFFVYGIIPLGIAIGEPSFHRFVIVCALEIT